MARATLYYEPRPRDDRAERARILEIAETRVRYGLWRIRTLMRREGWLIYHKKTHRIYVEEGLNLRRKRPRRRVAAAHREERPQVSRIDVCWSMDFVADELFNGWRIRTNNPMERIMREIRRRTRVVGCFPDGESALMLVAARLRHIAGTKWGYRRYLSMDRLREQEEPANEAAS